MRRATLLLLLSASMLAATPSRSEACSCIPAGPPCEATWKAALVFAGKVIEIAPLEQPKPGMPAQLVPKRIRFAVSEAFRGSDTTEVVLHSRGGGSGMCEYPFRLGEEYLVYAGHRGVAAGWETSTCSRTRPLRQASEDLAYLRLPDASKGSSRLTGRVIQRVFDLSTQRMVEPALSNVPIRVTGGRSEIQGRTDSNGNYSIPVDPFRAYEVTFGPVEGLVIDAAAWGPVMISDHRACGVIDGIARYDGRITGVIVDSQGRPVPSFKVGLRSSPRVPYGPGFDEDVVTDAQGRFEFRGVQPAAYEIVVSPSPGRREAPQVLSKGLINLEPSQRVSVGRLRLAQPR